MLRSLFCCLLGRLIFGLVARLVKVHRLDVLESELIFFLGYPLDCPGDDERLEAGFTEGGGAAYRGLTAASPSSQLAGR